MGHSIASFLSANLRIPPTRLLLISPADCLISAIHFCVKIRKQAKQLSLRKVLSEILFQSMYIERDCEHRQTTCRPLSPPTMQGSSRTRGEAGEGDQGSLASGDLELEVPFVVAVADTIITPYFPQFYYYCYCYCLSNGFSRHTLLQWLLQCSS